MPPSGARLIKDLARIFKHPIWPPALRPMTEYSRIRDDHDGAWEGKLVVMFSEDGDAYIHIEGKDFQSSQILRFRTMAGGGNSPHTRNALMYLAEAMRLDEEKRPDPKPY